MKELYKELEVMLDIIHNWRSRLMMVKIVNQCRKARPRSKTNMQYRKREMKNQLRNI